MNFSTAFNGKRPIRLSAKTRKWAYESMNGKYGTQAMQTPYLEIDCVNFDEMTELEKYDFAIMEIAKRAPVRVTDAELVSGSATLGGAIFHKIPVTHNGEVIFNSISHLTIDYETTLKKGVNDYERRIKEKLDGGNLTSSEVDFLHSLLNAISALRVYHKRYLDATKYKKPQTHKNLLQVPFSPARNFHEAVQSVWFIFSFVRLTGNWPGIGRLDAMLGEYLKKDLLDGTLTKKQAREILASFFIKGTEWIQRETPLGTGDAQHYQNIVLAGIDEFGKEVTNEVTYLTLDIVEETGISDFPITVRINEKTSIRLLKKIAKVMRHGGGVVAVYNEPLILRAMEKAGYSTKQARNFANDGCWEVQVPGATKFWYWPFDSLAMLQNQTLKGYERIDFTCYEQLYEAYKTDLYAFLDKLHDQEVKKNEKNIKYGGNGSTPTSVISLFENDCIDKARSYHEGGVRYTVCSPHIGGIADTVNTLYAIKKLVFDQKKVTIKELFNALKNDFKGNEKLRALTSTLSYYGTDNDEVDSIYTRLIDDYTEMCAGFDSDYMRFLPGASTFGREIEWRVNRLAVPSGATANSVLAGNSSPSPGTDDEGATACIKSYCKADLSKMTTGTALDIKISPQTLDGDTGITALVSLIRAFVDLGGYFMQIDTVSAQTLLDAQRNPSKYKTLSVRVSGWNARFITLSKEWQDMIINRTAHDNA